MGRNAKAESNPYLPPHCHKNLGGVKTCHITTPHPGRKHRDYD